jgi:hypothetical protein
MTKITNSIQSHKSYRKTNQRMCVHGPMRIESTARYTHPRQENVVYYYTEKELNIQIVQILNHNAFTVTGQV